MGVGHSCVGAGGPGSKGEIAMKVGGNPGLFCFWTESYICDLKMDTIYPLLAKIKVDKASKS